MNRDRITRKLELDTIKFFAIFIIYSTHFIASFCPNAFSLWEEFPSNVFLFGISGKLGVAILGVLLGFFAYSGSNGKTLVEYGLHRYGYFVYVGLFINTIMSLWDGKISLDVFPVSFAVSSDIFPTFWCMRDFLFASIVAFYLGQVKASLNSRIIIILILIILGQVWLPICLFGTLICDVSDSKFFSNKYLNIVWMIGAWILIKRPESNLTYMLDGIFAVTVVCVVEKSHVLKRIFSNKVTSSIGKRSMAIFVIHPIVYTVLGRWMLENWMGGHILGLIIVWLVCFGVICAMAYPVTWLLNMYTILANRIGKMDLSNDLVKNDWI